MTPREKTGVGEAGERRHDVVDRASQRMSQLRRVAAARPQHGLQEEEIVAAEHATS